MPSQIANTLQVHLAKFNVIIQIQDLRNYNYQIDCKNGSIDYTEETEVKVNHRMTRKRRISIDQKFVITDFELVSVTELYTLAKGHQIDYENMEIMQLEFQARSDHLKMSRLPLAPIPSAQLEMTD